MSHLPHSPHPSNSNPSNLNSSNLNNPTAPPDRLTPVYLATAPLCPTALASFAPVTLSLPAHSIVIITNPETPPPPAASDSTIGNDQLGAAFLTLVLALAIIAL